MLGTKNNQTRLLGKLLYSDTNIAICPPIYQELLQGVKTIKEQEQLEVLLEGLMFLNTDSYKIAEKAALMYRQARKKGVTILKPYDFLIAAYSIEFETIFVHNDKDFDALGKLFPLNIYKS